MVNPEPLRVLVTGPSLVGHGAGIQQHVGYLLTAFSDTDRISVVPFASTSSAYRESWATKGLRLLGVWMSMYGAARASDVVHINTTVDRRSMIRDGGLAAIARLRGVPVVVQFHGGSVGRLHGFPGVVARVFGSSFRAASRVLFLSEQQARSVCEALGLRDCEVIGNYVDVASLAAPVREEHVALHVLYLGRLDVEKGVAEVVEAVRSAPERIWELRIAGSGSLESDIAKTAEANPRISYFGFVGPDLRMELMGWADVLCLPSAHDEGLPYAVLEAAVAGCALVTSAAGALAEVNIDGVTGVIVAARDAAATAGALAALDDDRAALRRMQENARERVAASYSFERMRAVFERVWTEAVSVSEDPTS